MGIWQISQFIFDQVEKVNKISKHNKNLHVSVKIAFDKILISKRVEFAETNKCLAPNICFIVSAKYLASFLKQIFKESKDTVVTSQQHNDE